MGQVHFQELFLLLNDVQAALNLVEGLFGPEVWLVVQSLDGPLRCFLLLLFGDLVANEFAVGPILLYLIDLLYLLHPIHVVDGRVELVLFLLAQALYLLYLLVESRQGLFVHSANHFVRPLALVLGVVIHGKWTLRAEEFRHRSVVLA